MTGASKGIGAGIATGFGAAAAKVAVGYARDRRGAERIVSEIEAAGGTAIAVQGDLARTADIESMIAEAVATRPDRHSGEQCSRVPLQAIAGYG